MKIYVKDQRKEKVGRWMIPSCYDGGCFMSIRKRKERDM